MARRTATVYKADLLLFLAALVWGTGFVAQRAGMRHVGPMTFNGIRFALGALAVLPTALLARRKEAGTNLPPKWLALGGALAGLVLFVAVSFQQFGIVHTTAGKAGFITGLYMVFVPFIGYFVGQRAGLGSWVGAAVALAGLYLLSVTGPLRIARGDLLVFIGAVFWAVHIVVLGWLAPRCEPAGLACVQFTACAVLSTVAALVSERVSGSQVAAAALPIVYGGVMSVGVGFTLQVAGQRGAPPAHAALLLSLEAVFAAVAGWLLLGEGLTPRGTVGCALILAGVLVSQLTRR